MMLTTSLYAEGSLTRYDISLMDVGRKLTFINSDYFPPRGAL